MVRAAEKRLAKGDKSLSPVEIEEAKRIAKRYGIDETKADRVSSRIHSTRKKVHTKDVPIKVLSDKQKERHARRMSTESDTVYDVGRFFRQVDVKELPDKVFCERPLSTVLLFRSRCSPEALR